MEKKQQLKRETILKAVCMIEIVLALLCMATTIISAIYGEILKTVCNALLTVCCFLWLKTMIMNVKLNKEIDIIIHYLTDDGQDEDKKD